MPSLDISRDILQPGSRDIPQPGERTARVAFHYTGVGFQQGRVPLDSDANDAEALGAQELGLALAETICSAGSPNDGFRITLAEEGEPYDPGIGQGSFYLGGLRFDQPAPDVTYLTQTDWLQRPLDAPDPPEAPEAERNDLVWLEAREQVVSATEDAELLEPALGGPDTTGRVRRSWRVRIETGVAAEDCREAFADLIATFDGATYEPGSGALVSETALTVGFADDGEPENLCTPSAREGFLGARNEAYRVRITEPGRFIWGRDNASPVYRVRVVDHVVEGASTGLRRIEFLTLPRDQFAQPLAGQAVELHRWGALLPNHEKQSEPTGLLLTVERGYDPADDSVVLSAPVPQDWLDWFDAEGAGALSEHDDESVRRYFYLRLWTGGSGDAAAPDHAFTVDDAVALGDTGLTVSFSAAGRPGDYWVVSARPNTPREVQPWRLRNGAPPNGPALHVAPLALIRWRTDADGTLVPDVEDCRHRFRPLCQVRSCCTVTVGDGHTSHGDVDSIGEAIRRLPPEGGEVCILPGAYKEHVVLEGRSNVTITGCGARSLWSAEEGEDAPLLTILDASNITVRRLAMAARSVTAIRMERGGEEGALDAILLSELAITAADHAAIMGFDGTAIAITQCRITLEATTVPLDDDPAVGREPAIYLGGEQLSVERCRILADPTRNAMSQPLGGIQIGGGSERVLIRHNVIEGGNGHGVILGSIRFVSTDPDGPLGLAPGSYTASMPWYGAGTATGPHIVIGLPVAVDDRGCVVVDPKPSPPDGEDGETLVPVSDGALYDVRIHDNDIRAMGLSGVSVAFFFDLAETPDLIGVEDLEVLRNRIEGCLRGDLSAFTDSMTLAAGYGGIALAQIGDGIFRDNEIVGNGRDSLVQVSGIFVLFAAAIVIEGNRIHDNGRPAGRDDSVPFGRRGGVVIGLALNGSAATFVTDTGLGERRQALRLHDNFIDSPNARALKVIALGPVSVIGNRLSGRGRSVLGQYGPLIGLILGASAGGIGFQAGLLGFLILAAGTRAGLFGAGLAILEIYLEILGGDVVSLVDVAPPEELTGLIDPTGKGTLPPTLLGGGEILFNDNQVSHAAHAPGADITLSANLLSSFDDVSASGNQFECENDLQFVLANAIVTGMTVRITSNRFQEPLPTGRAGLRAYLSAFTSAFIMNATVLNQGNHCFYVAGPLQVDMNQSLIGSLLDGFCGPTRAAAADLKQPGNYYQLGRATGGT